MTDIFTLRTGEKRVAIVIAEDEAQAREMLRCVVPRWPEGEAQAFRQHIDCGQAEGVIFTGRME